MDKFVDLKALQLYTERLKEYINLKISLAQNKRTNCPNCGAVITGTKCAYCGTDFEAIAKLS